MQTQITNAFAKLNPDQEWILSPYDTWEKNPHFTGKPGRHPEDDFHDEEDLPVRSAQRLARCDEVRLLESSWDDVIPF
jgi:hypothetical protein